MVVQHLARFMDTRRPSSTNRALSESEVSVPSGQIIDLRFMPNGCV